MKEFYVGVRRCMSLSSTEALDKLHDDLENAGRGSLNTSGVGWNEASGLVTFDLWINAATARVARLRGIELVTAVLALSLCAS